MSNNNCQLRFITYNMQIIGWLDLRGCERRFEYFMKKILKKKKKKKKGGMNALCKQDLSHISNNNCQLRFIRYNIQTIGSLGSRFRPKAFNQGWQQILNPIQIYQTRSIFKDMDPKNLDPLNFQRIQIYGIRIESRFGSETLRLRPGPRPIYRPISFFSVHIA